LGKEGLGGLKRKAFPWVNPYYYQTINGEFRVGRRNLGGRPFLRLRKTKGLRWGLWS